MIVTEAQALQCCASTQFARLLSDAGDLESSEKLLETAREIWWRQIDISGWLEAFAAHPKIGDVDTLRKKFGGFVEMSRSEQAAAAGASEQELQELADYNRQYEERFGHIFIVCAAGKSAGFILGQIKSRFHNSPYKELSVAAAEQMKITELRLLFLLPSAPPPAQAASAGNTSERRSDGKPLVSPITSHVLDTSRGRPAEAVQILLERKAPGSDAVWEFIATAATNADGRVPQLLAPSRTVQSGIYRVTFDTATYMQTCRRLHPDFFPEKPFYPSAAVEFEITPTQTAQHFHIPLTWNPFGYSTYRGS